MDDTEALQLVAVAARIGLCPTEWQSIARIHPACEAPSSVERPRSKTRIAERNNSNGLDS